MKKERDYHQDIVEIRSMMERSSKFLSISGWAGILAGIVALAGVYIAYAIFNFDPEEPDFTSAGAWDDLQEVIFLALGVLVLALGSTVLLSYRKTKKMGEALWTPTSRRLLLNMSVPFVTGAFLILILISKGLIGFIAPFSLLFYGLTLVNASRYTFSEVKVLGLVQIGLGLLGSLIMEWGLLLWAVGFGPVHIVYGIYMNLRYGK